MRIMVTQHENTVIVNIPDGATIDHVRSMCQASFGGDTPPQLHLDVMGLPMIHEMCHIRDGDRIVARTPANDNRKRARHNTEDDDAPEPTLQTDMCEDAKRLIRMAVRSSFTTDLEGNEIITLDQLDPPNAVTSLLNSASVPLTDLFETFSSDVSYYFEDVLVPQMTADHLRRMVNSHNVKLFVIAPSVRHRMIGESVYTFRIARVPTNETVTAETDLTDYDCMYMETVRPDNELFQLYMMDFIHNSLVTGLTNPDESFSYA